jgi:hypothetical protein
MRIGNLQIVGWSMSCGPPLVGLLVSGLSLGLPGDLCDQPRLREIQTETAMRLGPTWRPHRFCRTSPRAISALDTDRL